MEQESTKRIEVIINKIFNTSLISIVIGIVLFLKTILFYKNTMAINEGLSFDLILGTFWFILIFVLFTGIMPKKARVPLAVVGDILISLLLIFDNLYYVYASSFLSIAQIGNLRYINEIVRTIPSLLSIWHIFYFIDIILIFILVLLKKIHFEEGAIEKTEKNILKLYVVFVIIGLLIFVGINYVDKGKEDPYNKDIQMKKTTVFGYHIYDIESILNEKHRTKYKNYNDMIKEYDALKEKYDEQYGEI